MYHVKNYYVAFGLLQANVLPWSNLSKYCTEASYNAEILKKDRILHHSVAAMLPKFNACHWHADSWRQAAKLLCCWWESRQTWYGSLCWPNNDGAEDACLPIDYVILHLLQTCTHAHTHTNVFYSDILENSTEHWSGTSKEPSLHHCLSSSTPLAEWLKSPAVITF